MSTQVCLLLLFASSRAVSPICKTIIINYSKILFYALYNYDNTRSGSNKNFIQDSAGSTDKE